MVFAIKGVGVTSSIKFLFLWLSKRVLHILLALYYIHIVAEVTINVAEYISSFQF